MRLEILMSMTLLVGACDQPSKPAPTAAPPTKVEAPSPASKVQAAVSIDAGADEMPFAKLDAIASLPEAIKFCSDLMEDTKNEQSDGAELLALWSKDKMRWADVAVATNETSLAKVKKTPNSERGRRMCVDGQVVQLAKDKITIYEGVLATDDGQFVRLTVAGSNGALAPKANSTTLARAKFCGVVTGIITYRNPIGGDVHAVHLVGMFDLPENRTPPAK